MQAFFWSSNPVSDAAMAAARGWSQSLTAEKLGMTAWNYQAIGHRSRARARAR